MIGFVNEDFNSCLSVGGCGAWLQGGGGESWGPQHRHFPSGPSASGQTQQQPWLEFGQAGGTSQVPRRRASFKAIIMSQGLAGGLRIYGLGRRERAQLQIP